ncbi:MAG TPA: hypothetical protein VHX88_01925 [Solirubrobacteraceae bacterium]|jgi:hypothetical protein|nr:hypothetical protein [Solirubrobacteraceae bacterium]
MSRAGASLAVLLVALLACASAHAADLTPAQAIANLNQWRAQVGENPVSSTPVAAWDAGCQDHDRYEIDNGVTLTHVESPSAPGYAAAGAQAATDSVLGTQGSSGGPGPASRELPRTVWDGAVFHRAALLDPRLAQIGFAATTTFASPFYDSLECLWAQSEPGDAVSAFNSGASAVTPSLTLYPSPPNGASQVPLRFPGQEAPDPTQETGVPGGATLGWLISVAINGPWSDGGFGDFAFAGAVTATLKPDVGGAALPVVVSQCGASGCANPGGTAEGPYFNGGFGLFPTHPLAPDTTYRVVVQGTVTTVAPNAPASYPINGYSWCFSTGAYHASADCAAATTGAGPELGSGAPGTTPGASAGPTLVVEGSVGARRVRGRTVVGTGRALRCPAGGPACVATVTGRSNRRTGRAKGTPRVGVGHASITARAGRTVALTFTLNPRGRALLARHRRLAIALTVGTRLRGGAVTRHRLTVIVG